MILNIVLNCLFLFINKLDIYSLNAILFLIALIRTFSYYQHKVFKIENK